MKLLSGVLFCLGHRTAPLRAGEGWVGSGVRPHLALPCDPPVKEGAWGGGEAWNGHSHLVDRPQMPASCGPANGRGECETRSREARPARPPSSQGRWSCLHPPPPSHRLLVHECGLGACTGQKQAEEPVSVCPGGWEAGGGLLISLQPLSCRE